MTSHVLRQYRCQSEPAVDLYLCKMLVLQCHTEVTIIICYMSQLSTTTTTITTIIHSSPHVFYYSNCAVQVHPSLNCSAPTTRITMSSLCSNNSELEPITVNWEKGTQTSACLHSSVLGNFLITRVEGGNSIDWLTVTVKVSSRPPCCHKYGNNCIRHEILTRKESKSRSIITC